MKKGELLAVLSAYVEATAVACPGLHPDMAERSQGWPKTTEKVLESELERYLIEASEPSRTLRIFFKMGYDLLYAGCNRQFATDAGLSTAREIIGLDDFHERISWVAQAAKYRRDDREVMQHGLSKLGIIERQASATGVIWLHTSKVPILDGHLAVGVFGTYEVIDAATAFRRTHDRTR